MECFNSGKIILAGGKSTEELQKVAKFVHKLFLVRGYIAPFPQLLEIQIRNIVISGRFGEQVDLEKMMEDHGSTKVSYEVELFPGAIVKLSGLKATVFHNGKFNMYGLKRAGDIDVMYNKLKTLVIPYCK